MKNKKTEHQAIHTRCFEKLTNMSYSNLFLIWMGLVLIFAMGYFIFATVGDIAHHGPEELVNTGNPFYRLLNALYFSIITATSTGYGDITPRGISKGLAALQSMSALFVFAIFVTKLVAHRQEIALREVHRLTFEDVFHNIREGLFIVRKDFDGLIEKAESHTKLVQEDWDTLIIAYKQAQSLISEIPDFYDGKNHLYTLDARREEMLHEAVHRTLHRINHMLDSFSKNGIAWIENDRSMNELQELMHIVNTATPIWQEKSPYQKSEAFADILRLKDSVQKHIGKAL